MNAGQHRQTFKAQLAITQITREGTYEPMMQQLKDYERLVLLGSEGVLEEGQRQILDGLLTLFDETFGTQSTKVLSCYEQNKQNRFERVLEREI